jgi:hypothetical protein
VRYAHELTCHYLHVPSQFTSLAAAAERKSTAGRERTHARALKCADSAAGHALGGETGMCFEESAGAGSGEDLPTDTDMRLHIVKKTRRALA